MARIITEHVDHWFRHGYVIIPGFLTADELKRARENVARYYPSSEEYHAAPERYRSLALFNEFPFAGDALNELTTHDELIDFAERVLGVDQVFVTQSLLWAKYAGTGDWEQPLHRDYGNNTLVVPRDDGPFRQIPMILYYDDVHAGLGPTHVVSQEATRDVPLVPLGASLEDRPGLYEHEQAVVVEAGTLLIYSMATFHRGSTMTATSGARFSHHIVWRAAGYEWMGWRALARHGNEAETRRFIERATPRQRTVLGFPPPGHEYWNEETLAGTALRYPGMDMSPYRDALAPTSNR